MFRHALSIGRKVGIGLFVTVLMLNVTTGLGLIQIE